MNGKAELYSGVGQGRNGVRKQELALLFPQLGSLPKVVNQ